MMPELNGPVRDELLICCFSAFMPNSLAPIPAATLCLAIIDFFMMMIAPPTLVVLSLVRLKMPAFDPPAFFSMVCKL